ncbi:hypothetical protein PIB30_004263 [Stylosanthes scabra]|uniref:Uncharacterized protein n=1 Tax=Stylosanthes scabra TaxID=79078 RepID=A0ABU6S488_9FABA|nr:hypothetical protein [Stylosanthes scabra]
MARGDVNIRPSNVPEDMNWVDDLVLLPQSVMDEELLAKFRESHAICGTLSEESQYELVPPDSEERDVLYECQVAPSQLHPNSWGFMKAFQTKSQWSSFRAREGRRIFTLYEELFHNFKNYYFKLRVVEDVRPFYENEKGEAPFNTKILLPRSPSYICTELEKMTNNSDAYKRMRARKKNQANRLAAAISGSKDNLKGSSSPVNRAPPGTENQSVPFEPEIQSSAGGSEFKVPKTPANPGNTA